MGVHRCIEQIFQPPTKLYQTFPFLRIPNLGGKNIDEEEKIRRKKADRLSENDLAVVCVCVCVCVCVWCVG